MDSLTVIAPVSLRSTKDDGQRVKFLCSFNGSILPRPRDGKLRYVGGETRIMSIPRDITYKGLMDKMREIFEEATVMKYQQPDEDLDALVSVVNDDDVAIMMEECDKLGSGNGFTRLRVFLFVYPDQDISVWFGDGEERDNERMYMDALNSLNESPDFRRQHGDSTVVGSLDYVSAAEQYLNQNSAESSPDFRRHMELPMAQMNLSRLTIPRRGSGQLQQAVSQRCNEMEAPWSPAYYSPRHLGAVDQRLVSEFHTSPSSYRMMYGDFVDKSCDIMGEDYNRHPVNIHPVYEQQSVYTDNAVLIPAGSVVNNSGLSHNSEPGSSVYEGNNICENCQMRFYRNQVYPSSCRRPGDHPHLDQNLGNGYLHVPNSCAECPPNRETLFLNSDANLQSPYYETLPLERGWGSRNQPNPLPEEPKPRLSVTGRLTDGYVVENGINFPIRHEDQFLASGSQVNRSPVEDHGLRYGNFAYPHGTENVYQVPHGHGPPQTVWRNVHGLLHGGPSYETSISPHLMNVPVPIELNPSGMPVPESLNCRVESSQKVVGLDCSVMPEYTHVPAVQLVPSTCVLENPNISPMEPFQLGVVTSNVPLAVSSSVGDVSVAIAAPILESQNDSEKNCQQETNNSVVHEAIAKKSDSADVITPADVDEGINNVSQDTSENQLEFLPELIASVKEAALKSLKEIKDQVHENVELNNEHEYVSREDARIQGWDGHGELEADSDNETVTTAKIEPTKAEAEAIDRGLQTIKNEDLEEIRELGSGTYGSVYHGKWKGSDVAIKKIKSSCFAGKPSERERLFADFWKEALLLSSLHHPNVVSFYGVVRDGPDGSLATVTEFMINGSLKQFLRKKDRSIDRRKRILIAMDVAFGMEYLHGKNVVHFDLKCENLLVNIRDPHRPVCKIGDLGLSKVKQHTLVSGGVRGTLPWMAPELLSGKSNMVTEKIDVYSYGIVMWELLTGDEPYTDMHCAAIIGGIVNDTLRPEIPTWCDPEWKALMESCWSSDQSERPSFSQISQRLRNMSSAMNPK